MRQSVVATLDIHSLFTQLNLETNTQEDPSSYACWAAFTVNEADLDGTETWYSGFWTQTANGWAVTVLVGPDGGTVELPVGRYGMSVKVDAGGQMVVLPAGPVYIY